MEKTVKHTKRALRAAKRHGKWLAKFEKIRFALVGMINTIVDFIVLNGLVMLFGMPMVQANIVSATAAIITSFTLNRSAVFKGHSGNTTRQIVLFFVVTLASMWLIQNVVMVHAYDYLREATDWHNAWLLNIAKLLGISAGLVWNYTLYRHLVFRQVKPVDDEPAAEHKADETR